MHVMALSLATALLVLGATAASAAVAADVPSGEQPPAGVVSATPATGTPHLSQCR